MRVNTTPAKYISPSGIEVSFDFKEVNLSFGRKLAIVEYPQYAGGDVEDLGHGIEELSLACLFFGPQWVQNSLRFLDALREQGSAILEHPRFGRMAVVPSSVAYKENLVGAYGKSIVEVSFRKTGQEIVLASDGSLSVDESRATPQAVAGDAQELEQLSEAVNAELTKDLEQKIAGQKINASVFNSFKTAVLSPMQRINQALGNGWRLAFSWQSAFTALEIGISGVLSAPDQIINIMSAFLHPFRSLSTNEQLQFIGAIDDSFASPAVATVMSASEQQAAATGTMISQTMITMLAIELSAELQKTLPSRVAALALLSQVDAIQLAYDQSMHTIFQHVNLNTSSYPVAVAQSVERSFSITKNIILNNLNQLRVIMTRTLAHQMPSCEVMFLLYGDRWTNEHLVEFFSLNNLSGEEIFLIGAGKQVVFYG